MLGNTNDARGAARTSDGKATRGGDGRSLVPLAKALARGDARAVLSFAGQGIEWLPELAELARSEPWVRELCEAASVALEAWAAEREVSWSGLFAGGFSLASWLAGEAVSPQHLAATPVSMPGIFLTQVARFESLRRRGLGGAFEAGGIVATTGYSQGLAAATLVAECEGGALAIPRVLEYLRVMAWLGFEVARATRDASSEPGSPMAVVVGPDAKAIDLALQGLDGLDGQGAWLALQNDRRRHVLSGTPRGLRIARERLEERAKREADARKAGRHGGAVMTVSWEEVATTAAFHSPLVLDGLERTLERVERAGFRVSPRLPVFDPGQTVGVGEATRSGLLLDPANASTEALTTATRALVASIAVETGRWQRNLFGVLAHANPTDQSVDVVLDLGPGEGVSRLTAGALRGTGVDSTALGGLGGEERERFFTAPRGPAPLRYDELMPRLAELPDGRVVVDNAFSRATGTPPIILPGMTPTTVDVPIVAAAANAGFTVELAGGGQVSDAVFQARMDELAEALEPGVEVAFNALLLDAYLWGLHLGDKRLVQKARAQGAPLSGVTVSAGIPSVDQAVALLDELAALGMRLNAFKPGTKSQIDEVIAIARAARHHRIFIHIEGGKAGGHHSWEDLDALLLDTYHLIRSQPNLVLCVGGGIADEARSTALLTGAWAERYGLPAMPVDAIFLGTLTMACREATATASVKTALARAQGTDRWVGRGQVQGGVTSGRSQLDADIHYLDNAAARCGRLLDEVAGNAAAVSARRDEIIEALAKTAKPYFGDFDAMTWPEVLERMVALMALGGVTPRYDDGPWLDVSWRARVFDVVRRAEARLAGASGTDHLVESVCPDPSALDAPAIVLAALSERYPLARTTRVHPADATWFLREVCARPGKPVPFVPVIDQDVRRWYKSDSLWQAQHPRFDGDQVLVIPGPEAVMGITREDEPVAELLGRFDRALVASLVARGEVPRRLDALEGAAAQVAWGDLPGVELEPGVDPSEVVLRVVDAVLARELVAQIGRASRGPLAALCTRSEREGLIEGKRRVDNPLPRLAAPIAGATYTLRLVDRRLVRLDLVLGGHGEAQVAAERLRLEEVDGRIVLELGWDVPSAYRLDLRPELHGGLYRFHLEEGATDRAVASMYQRTLFATPAIAVPLFEVARETVRIEADRQAAYLRITARRAIDPEAGPALAQVFSLAWPAIFRGLSCDELAGGLLRLVHLDNRVERLARTDRWVDLEEVRVAARVTRVEDAPDHRIVHVLAELETPITGEPLARLRSSFHIRMPGRALGVGALTTRMSLPIQATVDLSAAGIALLGAAPWSQWIRWESPVSTPCALTITAEIAETRRRRRDASFDAHQIMAGALSVDGRVVASLVLDRNVVVGEGAEHPLVALLATLGVALGPDGATSPQGGPDGRAARPTPRRTLASASDIAVPRGMGAFAEIGGDLNPIHRSALAARLAGLAQPIAHGMWTAARLESFLVDEVAKDAQRIADLEVRFLAPVLPGERLVLSATRVGVVSGRSGDGPVARGTPSGLMVEATAAVRRTLPSDDPEAAPRVVEIPVAAARARMASPRVAYVFPGQGIQQKDMGMASLQRSPAARRAWERADAFCRAELGFSILRVVRENPPELRAGRELLRHPQGVLHLTQLTQVAMAVLAYAQVAELREAGVWADDAVLCGHSVGEYNALSAGADVFPLEAVIAIVYQRGRVMHGLVPRDATGESGYRMGVIRPQYAGLDHAGAEALVEGVAARTGRFLEIVNYNVRGRQYSVTGHADALAALGAALEKLQRPGSKPAYIEVPGIDVPFHSRELRRGVADFRAALDRHLPAEIEPSLLVGRYIPNLIAEPFALTRAFVAAVRDAVGDDSRVAMQAILDAWTDQSVSSPLVTRALLVELLAWQFASPVRWIDTQEVMLQPRSRGGLGVTELVEVGVGYQPTLANMARQSLAVLAAQGRAPEVQIFNVEAERAQVFAEDADPVSVEVAERAPVAAAPAPSTPSAPSAPVAVAESVVTAASRPDDRGLTHAEALTTLIALQTKLRPEQIGPAETIDGLFDGVSSRRNQVLMDLGAEFDAGSIDRAHEIPLADLSRELAARAPTWRAPGAYLQIAHDEALKRVLARSGLTPREAAAHLETAFGFGPGLIAATFDVLALTTRAGASARGGELGPLGTDAPTSKDQARSLLDRAVGFLGQRRGTTYGRLGGATSTGGGAIVDARAVQALSDKIFGEGGALLEAARVFARASGKDLDAPSAIDPELAQAKAKLEALGAELGQDFIALVEPRFDSHLHVAFASAWASAHRDLVRLALDGLNGRVDQARVTAELARLAPHRGATRLRDAALWFSRQATDRGLLSLADALAAFAAGTAPSVPQTAGAFAGRTALVTGASPGSIAVEVVSELLAGGARVVVTTTQANASRLAFYRRIYERAAAPGAELHVVPMNQASFADVDALVDWLFRAETEQAGATTRVLKPAFLPDLVVPFAALKDQGTVDQLSGLSEATLRAMVLSTERMIALIARRLIATGEARKAHVLLPLSPNHGAFGGDGAYAESKAALEVLLAKWTSEHHAWGRATTLVGARIGWVRGTGLMAQNDAVAPRLEAKTGIRTWSSAEMGRELAALLGDETRARAASGPIVADLSGGFDQVPDLKSAVDEVRRELELEERQTRERERLATSFTDRVHGRSSTPSGAAAVRPLPAWPAPITPAPRDAIAAWPTRETSDARAKAEDLVVIVGFGEISPGGSARTRYEVEVQATAGRHDGTGARGRLSAAAVLELAWLTGLVRYEPAAKGGTWVDAESGDPVPEHALHERYHDAVRTRVGVRFVEPETVGFDPERLPVFEKVFLDKDFTFRAGSEEEARTFAASDPDRTVYKFDAASDAWLVTRKAGSELRVPREVRFNRRVAGQLPRGFSLARYGFGGEMLENVDPVALMNLAATVEAFISAGTSPEELLAYVHPSRIGTTQGSGMGGMRSLHRLYVDHLLGRDRQSDILQETLINVVFAYAASSYVGSYGPMAHPVAACATAALSLEDAMDKILLGKADVVMAGGWDDLSQEGVVGFGDMNATADTDKMEAMGILPHQMSRANDRRRRGFVEAQGGGAMLLARGDVALEMGLPVYGVLAYAGSFGDGINRSIPAPGIGSLGAAVGGKRSPLGKALAKLGLTADDIGVVSKHDTSTAANDPNESYIHQTLQDALGRTPGNPLMVVSQKTVLGHAKGGAAAWQTIGLCQMLASGVIPGNANLESVDPGHEAHQHLLYSNERLEPGPAYPLRAGLATSLGFGHVSALLLIAHPDAFEAAIADPTARSTWKARSTARQSQASRHLGEVMLGRRPLFEKRVERRFKAPDGSDAQRQEETAMLLDPAARMPLGQETFVATRSTE